MTTSQAVRCFIIGLWLILVSGCSDGSSGTYIAYSKLPEPDPARIPGSPAAEWDAVESTPLRADETEQQTAVKDDVEQSATQTNESGELPGNSGDMPASDLGSNPDQELSGNKPSASGETVNVTSDDGSPTGIVQASAVFADSKTIDWWASAVDSRERVPNGRGRWCNSCFLMTISTC